MHFSAMDLAALIFQEPSLAAAKPVAAPHWYEQATGILAIPAALIGCAYSYLLIKKTQLESRKLELEIQKERSQLSLPAAPHEEAPIASPRAAEGIAETLVNRRYSIILLRYVVLELALSIYTGLTAPLTWAAQLFVGGMLITNGGGAGMSRIPMVIAETQSLTSTVISMGYWLLFAALGWPLFKDVNAALGIRVSEYSPRSIFRSIRSLKSDEGIS